MCEYESDETDNHGNGLRAADNQRIQRHRERLPDKLQLKVGARVILRRIWTFVLGGLMVHLQ